MKVQQYSEKSVVLISENEKEIEYIKLQKQVLKNLFGKFNPFLSCGPAWVFSSKREPDLKEFISQFEGIKLPAQIEQEPVKENFHTQTMNAKDILKPVNAIDNIYTRARAKNISDILDLIHKNSKNIKSITKLGEKTDNFGQKIERFVRNGEIIERVIYAGTEIPSYQYEVVMQFDNAISTQKFLIPTVLDYLMTESEPVKSNIDLTTIFKIVNLKAYPDYAKNIRFEGNAAIYTDGHKLKIIETGLNVPDCTIPIESLKAKCNIQFFNTYCLVDGLKVEYSTEKYPQYKQVMPDLKGYSSFKVDSVQLAKAIKSVLPTANKTTNKILLKISDQLTVSAEDVDFACESGVNVPLITSAPIHINIGFSGKIMLSVLESDKGETTIYYTESTSKAIVLQNNHYTLLMPMN
jgi:hypothetical protein